MSAAVSQNPVSAAQRIEELGRIILAYSEVTEKLQLSHAQLTQTVQMLREELSEKNRLLERKNRLAALGEMAAGLAHEIRNPLGGIQLYVSLLMTDLKEDPQSSQILTKISAGAKRLEALVGQVLQFSREILCNTREMDLAETIQQVVELSEIAAAKKHVRIEVSGPGAMPILGDPLLLGQAVMNLVLNAVEAMQESGAVTVRFSAPPAESDAKQFYLIVRDTGPGIPANILDRIFNPFFTTKDTGTGLGLAIVHRVVEAHNGTIHASNAESGGAKFEIRI
ncbi:MAG TPA: ATP-binding protein [Tepidisphaeraceae bacterium]|jgi:signal transduction histidine kinase|nr:ATP-binding protein [Tepidisphaeraceae bacterium]